MNLAYGVKQFIGDCRDTRGNWWRVLVSGHSGHYVFCMLHPIWKTDIGIHLLVKGTDLKKQYNRALKHGVCFICEKLW